jgi:hypothetical protein
MKPVELFGCNRGAGNAIGKSQVLGAGCRLFGAQGAGVSTGATSRAMAPAALDFEAISDNCLQHYPVTFWTGKEPD